MKHSLLALSLLAATFTTSYGQTRQTTKPAVPAKAISKPAPQAVPAKAETTDQEAPKYAGLYLNGKQVSEINCYGVDEYTIAYPFLSPLDICYYFSVVIRAGSYDTKGKFNLEYSEYNMYRDGDADAVRSKFAGKGYGIINRTGLLEKFNAHRTARPNELFEVTDETPSINLLKYTNFDADKITKSVLFIEVYTFTHSGRFDSSGDAIYTSSVIYRSPDILLKNRISTGAAGLKPSGAKKGLSFVPIVGGVVMGMKDKMLPEMSNENCDNPGRAISMTAIKKVGRDDIGEEIVTK